MGTFQTCWARSQLEHHSACFFPTPGTELTSFPAGLGRDTGRLSVPGDSEVLRRGSCETVERGLSSDPPATCLASGIRFLNNEVGKIIINSIYNLLVRAWGFTCVISFHAQNNPSSRLDYYPYYFTDEEMEEAQKGERTYPKPGVGTARLD